MLLIILNLLLVCLLRRISESPGCISFQRTRGSLEPNSNDRVRGSTKTGLEGDGLKLLFMSVCFTRLLKGMRSKLELNCLFN